MDGSTIIADEQPDEIIEAKRRKTTDEIMEGPTEEEIERCTECIGEVRAWVRPETILALNEYQEIIEENKTVENKQEMRCSYCGYHAGGKNEKGSHCHCHQPSCINCHPCNFCKACTRFLIPENDRRSTQGGFCVITV